MSFNSSDSQLLKPKVSEESDNELIIHYWCKFGRNNGVLI